MIDFLISLLTKQQSFLRDIANFVFKQFCTQISTASFQNMMGILATPNVEANKMLDDDEDLEAEEENEEEENGQQSEGDEEDDEESD